MHGRIMFINPENQTGMIVGADRNRYQFSLSNWEDDVPPGRNMEVSFATELYQAVKVRQSSGHERTVDIFPEPLQQTGGRQEPVFETPVAVTPEDIENFRDNVQLEDPSDDEGVTPKGFEAAGYEALTPGELLPELDEALGAPSLRSGNPSYAGQRAASPLFQVETTSTRPGSSIKYYAIGIVASLVVTGIAYVAVHL